MTPWIKEQTNKSIAQLQELVKHYKHCKRMLPDDQHAHMQFCFTDEFEVIMGIIEDKIEDNKRSN